MTNCSSKLRYKVLYGQEIEQECIQYKIDLAFLGLAVILPIGHMPLESCCHVCAFVPSLSMLLCKSTKDKLAIMLSLKEKQIPAPPTSLQH